MSNVSMSVVLRLKCLSNFVITSTREKVTNAQKPRLVSLIQKFIRYYSFLQSKRKTRMKTESTALAWQKETKCEEKESKDRLWIFFMFSVVVLTRASQRGPSSLVHVWVLDPFSELTPKWGRNFRLSSHRRVWWPTSCLYLIAFGCQLLFLFSFPRPLLTAFSFESPSSNQNSLSICCC